MRALEFSNPANFRPSKFASIGAVLPFLMSLLCLPLVTTTDPEGEFIRNPIVLTLCVVMTVSGFMFVWPLIFNWDWQAKYFGVLLLYLGSVSLIGFVPCLCIAGYGASSVAVRVLPLFLYVALHLIWCRRFVALYRHAHEDSRLRKLVYEEEDDAVYYLQRGDVQLLEKELKFAQLPKDRYFVIFIVAAVTLTSLRTPLSAALGVPFIHVFLLVSMLPVSLTCAGFAVRGWLIFYYYPRLISRMSGKKVYVDMSAKPSSLHSRNR